MTGHGEEATFIQQVRQFDFCGESIDASLRKLLARVQLPKEAQQIDRVMEEFASRYHTCNPTLIDKPDVAYAVAFSALLLHTDAHNKNVKQKMDKDTFIRRTKIIEGGEGVPAEILDIMYDNIVLSEFTYAADTITSRPERSNSWFSKFKGESNTNSCGNTTPNQPNTLLADLESRLEQLMPAKNSFRYNQNPSKPIPIVDIHFSLLTAKSLCLAGVRSRHEKCEDKDNTFKVRVTKAGILDRKHDLMQGGKRATARSWRPFGVILSGSQIIFFSDMTSYQSWLEEEDRSRRSSPRRNSSFPHSVSSLTASASNLSLNNTTSSSFYTENRAKASSRIRLQPIQIISLSYAVCIYDESYTKYHHVFRLITGDGQQYLLRASNDQEMNDWMLKINYAASLKTTGVGVKSFRRRNDLDIKYDLERQNRQEEAKEKAHELSDRIEEQIRLLERELQLRRNLMVLVPVHKSTKDRLIEFADMVGERIKHKRVELQRLECYRDYLESELTWCSSSEHQQNRKLSLPAHLSSDKPLRLNESFKSLSHLLYIPSSTSPSSDSSSASNTNSPSKNDQDDKIPVSFPKLVIDSPKKVMDRERVMRRRSQSNPIITNNEKLPLLHPPKANTRERSGSESSSIKEDDISVIIINEPEGTDSDSQQK